MLIIFLIRVLKDLWWIFNIEKSFQLLGWGLKFFFQIMMLNLLKNCFGKFQLKCPVLGNLHIFKTFFISITKFVSSRRFFYALIWILFEWWFFAKKVENWSKPKTFVTIVLITHFFSGIHILIFDLMNIQKISISRSFFEFF